MKRVCLFLFSGTGMTKYIVDKMKREFEKHQVHVDVFRIEDAHIQSILFDTYDIAGIAYPVHSFNAPKIVIDFAKRLPKTESKRTFIISSAGAYAPVNFASSSLLIKVLRKKRFDIFYDRTFEMPANFMIKDDEAKVLGKIKKADAEIPSAVSEIINNVPIMQHSGLNAKAAAFLGRVEWHGAKFAGKFFYTAESCNGCGVCADNCPNHNIIISNKRAGFRWDCGLCMRCLYMCPNHSIRVRRPLRFIGFNSWYENEELSIAGLKRSGHS